MAEDEYEEKLAKVKGDLKDVLLGVYDECKKLDERLTKAIERLAAVHTKEDLEMFIQTDIEEGFRYIKLDYVEDDE